MDSVESEHLSVKCAESSSWSGLQAPDAEMPEGFNNLAAGKTLACFHGREKQQSQETALEVTLKALSRTKISKTQQSCSRDQQSFDILLLLCTPVFTKCLFGLFTACLQPVYSTMPAAGMVTRIQEPPNDAGAESLFCPRQ